VTDEWFRSPDWSAEAQKDFEARLARARPYNRAQYVRIKGLALHKAGERRGARELWERVLQSTEELATTQQASALEHLGDSYVGDNAAAAEDYYRRLLEEHPTLNGTSHTAEISLAELLIGKGNRDSMEEALALLNSFLERGTSQFPSVLFRWHLALISIAQATGRKRPCSARREPRWTWRPVARSSHDTRTSVWSTPMPRPCVACASSPSSAAWAHYPDSPDRLPKTYQASGRSFHIVRAGKSTQSWR